MFFFPKNCHKKVEVDNSMVELPSAIGAQSAQTIKADSSPKMIQQSKRSLHQSIEIFSEQTCKGLNGKRRT